MRFTTEHELQQYCLEILKGKQIECSDEVWCGSVRADIVTPRAVIELKKTLNRESIYQALGQATTYNLYLKRPEIWIVGQLPVEKQEREQAQRIANEIEQNKKITVSFIEQDSFWWDKDRDKGGCMDRSFGLVVAGVIALVIGAIAALNRPDTGGALGSATKTTVTTRAELAPMSGVAPSLLPSPTPRAASSGTQAQQTLRIRTCNGIVADANFREAPTFAPASVLGVVKAGDSVSLTGQVVLAEGEQWHQAISPALSPSAEAKAQNRTTPNQVGWIAACFLGR